jgi:hypothetical protein
MPDALVFPEHFPPKTRWKKFFIGVRWLGPDLSFFRELKARQAARHPEAMHAWGGGLRQEIAERISRTLADRLRWKSTVFLPQDLIIVAFHGPRFDSLDDFIHEEILELVNDEYAAALPRGYWADKNESMTLGAFVDDVMRFKTLAPREKSSIS